MPGPKAVPWVLWGLVALLAVLCLVAVAALLAWRRRALAIIRLRVSPLLGSFGLVDATQHAQFVALKQRLAALATALGSTTAFHSSVVQDSATSTAMLLELPIVYSQADMAYVLPARVGQHVLQLVLDTGSYCMSVADAGCVANGKCRVPDARGYLAKQQQQHHSEGQASLTTLPYATVAMEAEAVNDEVTLIQDNAALHHLPRMTFFSAHHMSGTASHIAGLARHTPDITATLQCDALLDAMAASFPTAHQEWHWGMVARAAVGQGLLWFGAAHRRPHDLDALQWHNVPLVEAEHAAGLYMVHVPRVGVRSPDAAAKVAWLDGAAMGAPHGLYLLIDTGTAETYFPPAIAAAIDKAGVPLGLASRIRQPVELPGLVLDLGGGLWLEYDGPRYTVALDGSPLPAADAATRVLGRSTFHAYTPEIEAILGAKSSQAQDIPIVLFGIAHMQDMAWEFPWRSSTATDRARPSMLHVALLEAV